MQLTSAFLGAQRMVAPLVAAPQRGAGNASRQVTCMAKKKGVRLIVTLECTEARQEGGTPTRYTTQKVGGGKKGWRMHILAMVCSRRRTAGHTHALVPVCLQNKKNSPERLELMKYNKYLKAGAGGAASSAAYLVGLLRGRATEKVGDCVVLTTEFVLPSLACSAIPCTRRSSEGACASCSSSAEPAAARGGAAAAYGGLIACPSAPPFRSSMLHLFNEHTW